MRVRASVVVVAAILAAGITSPPSWAARWSAPRPIGPAQPLRLAVDENGGAALLMGNAAGGFQLLYGPVRSPRRIIYSVPSASRVRLGLAPNGRVLLAWTQPPASEYANGLGLYLTSVGPDGRTTPVVANPSWELYRLEFLTGRALLELWAPQTPGGAAFTFTAGRFVQVTAGPFAHGIPNPGFDSAYGITARGYGLFVWTRDYGAIEVSRAGPRDPEFGPRVTLRWARPTGLPRIAPAANGSLVVYWQERSTLWLQSFGSTGLPRGPLRSLNLPELPYYPYGGDQLYAQVVGDVGGAAYVLWRGTYPHAGLRLARISRHGGLGYIHRLAEGDAEGGPHGELLAANSHGQAIASWVDHRSNRRWFVSRDAAAKPKAQRQSGHTS